MGWMDDATKRCERMESVAGQLAADPYPRLHVRLECAAVAAEWEATSRADLPHALSLLRAALAMLNLHCAGGGAIYPRREPVDDPVHVRLRAALDALKEKP